MVTLSPFAGWLSDRIEPKIVASVRMSLTTIALAFFITPNDNTAFEGIIFTLAFNRSDAEYGHCNGYFCCLHW